MTTWRVLTWNILGSHRPNIDVIGEVMASYAPDVVAVQEIRHRQARSLARRLGWKVVWTRKHYPYTPLVWWRAEGLAIATPHAASELVTITISPGVSTWTHRHRVAMAATLTRANDAAVLRMINTHLASHDADERIAQAHRVVALIGDHRPAVVAGDLNAVDEVEVIREFGAVGLVDPGGDFSSPSIAPYQRLDYVLVPESATVTSQLVPDGGEPWHQLSDHLPVLVEFTV
ncbi:MAG TPA: endonuclease/exonuclease/phosphatase family protein [Ilumatobacteraceae bacterium]|nr:endonuclease/exonuclease/phosphatase family protein [Ilumatobacteraceae bacterium]